MPRYREVFAPDENQPADPGRVFYTIRLADAGKSVGRTTAGPVSVSGVIGRVLRCDAGKRLYRVPCDDPAAGWTWQCESAGQRDTRLTLSVSVTTRH
jgi:hypothetical protein